VTVAERVEAGARFLDEMFGRDWIELVNLDTLDIASGCCCVAAQTVDGGGPGYANERGYANAWERAMFEWGITRQDPLDPDITAVDSERARALGFLSAEDSYDDLALTEAWNDLIEARLVERVPA
jgi:hypothetical protein